MAQFSHAYAVGRIRVLERDLMTGTGMERLLSAKNESELMRAVTDLGWGDSSTQQQVEHQAAVQMQNACELIKSCSPEPEITECFLYKYDVHNLKTLIKSKTLSIEPEHLSACGTFDEEKLKHMVKENNYHQLPKILCDACQGIERKLSVNVDPLEIDSMLDKAMFLLIAENLKTGKNSVVKQYFEDLADITNLRTILRCKDMKRDSAFASRLLVDGSIHASKFILAMDNIDAIKWLFAGKKSQRVADEGIAAWSESKGLMTIEKDMDDYLIGLFKPFKYEITSVLPLIWYLLAKERETSIVRLILTAKLNSFPMEMLRERLRDLYA